MNGLAAVFSAIQSPAKHHRKMTFQEEFLALLMSWLSLSGELAKIASGARGAEACGQRTGNRVLPKFVCAQTKRPLGMQSSW